MPKRSAEKLVDKVNSKKLETLGGKTIEAATLESGMIGRGRAMCAMFHVF